MVARLPRMNGPHRGDRSEGEFFIVVQNREGRLAVVNLHNLEFGLAFWCRPREVKAGGVPATKPAEGVRTTGAATTQAAGDSVTKLVAQAIAMPARTMRPPRVQGGWDQSPTGLDFTAVLAESGQAKDLAAFPDDHRFFEDGAKKLAAAHKAWALAALLDHENVDAKVYAARGLLECADAQSVPALLAAAKANSYMVGGSENATLHMIYRETLKQALEKITGLQLTPKGLHMTLGPTPPATRPQDISSDEHPERFTEEVDFGKVERWLTEKYPVKAGGAATRAGGA